MYTAAVVTFRREAALAGVLGSILRQSIPPSLVVVVDNDPCESARETVEHASRSTDVEVRYTPMPQNVGPAGGWAKASGVALSDARRGEWLLVVDDDDPLGHPELVERLLQASTTVDEGLHLGAIGLRGAGLGRTARLHRIIGPEGHPTQVDYLASGGAPLYRWTLIEEIGFFDPDLFFGFEDLDMGLRMRGSGWTAWSTALPSLHTVAETSAERLPWREYYKSRALVHILRSHIGWKAVAITILRSTMLGSLALVDRERTFALAHARFRGAVDGWRGRLGPAGWAPTSNAPKNSPTAGTG